MQCHIHGESYIQMCSILPTSVDDKQMADKKHITIQNHTSYELTCDFISSNGLG